MSFKPIVAAISFSLALFLLLFMVWPKYQELRDVNQQISQTETQLEEGKEHIARLETLSDRLKKREEAVSKVESSLPSQSGLPSFLNFLYEISGDQGLLLRRVGSVSQSSYKGDIDQVSVELTLDGSYTDFRDFVKVVEKSARMIEVREMTFQMPEKQGEGNAPAQFDVKLSTHFYNPQ